MLDPIEVAGKNYNESLVKPTITETVLITSSDFLPEEYVEVKLEKINQMVRVKYFQYEKMKEMRDDIVLIGKFDPSTIKITKSQTPDTNQSKAISSNNTEYEDYGDWFPKKSSSSVGGGGITQNYSNGSSYNTSYYQGSVKIKPKLAFKQDGVEYWGSAESELSSLSFDKTDLIINCTGMKYNISPFIKDGPIWITKEFPTSSEISQIVLDWKDMQPAPKIADKAFWTKIVKLAKENSIKRIIVCCMAGQGRTGSALASLAYTTKHVENPREALKLIRKDYSDKAVETEGQMKYVLGLHYSQEEINSFVTKANTASTIVNSSANSTSLSVPNKSTVIDRCY